jgi:prepilin-type N-terminal cleavage/methylation domain-containing protein
MKALNHLKENKGFTLIELLISVCIMAIAFVTLLPALPWLRIGWNS